MRFKTLWRAAAVLMSAGVACASANAQLVVSQFYGGGGFQPSGPVFDCAEIFNRGSTVIDLTNKSVQFASATGTWNVVPLSGTLAPGQYLLVKTGASFNAAVGVTLIYDVDAAPLADTSTFISGGGRVAIVNGTTALVNTSGTCPLPNASILDFLAVGSTTCVENGATGAPAGSSGVDPPTNTRRKNGGCTDTDVNSADFETASPPNLRNRGNNAFFVVTGGSYTVAGSTTVGTPAIAAGSTLTLTGVRGTSACNPFSATITSVSANTSGLIGGVSNVPFSGSGTFTVNIPINAGQATGVYDIPITATDGVRTIVSPFRVRVTPPAPSNDTCAGAIDFTGAAFPVNFAPALTTALDDGYGVACNTGSVSNVKFGVWYRYTAQSSGSLVLDESSSVDVVYAVFESLNGTCPVANAAATTCLTTDTAQLAAVVAGRTYFILVGQQGASTTAPGANLGLTINFMPPLANDDCASATTFTLPLDRSLFELQWSNQNAQPPADNGTINCPTAASAMNNDVWYRFVAPASGNFAIINNITPTAASIRYALYDGGVGGTCPTGGSNLLSCNASVSPGFASATLTAGNVYFIQVASATAGTTATLGSLELALAPLPVGACCLAGNSCKITSQRDCTASTGTYSGDGSVCATPSATISSYVGPSIAITDGTSGTNIATNSGSITVPDSFIVADVTVDVNIAHSFIGDVVLVLSNGTRSIEFFHRPARGFNNTNFNGSPSALGTTTAGTTPALYTFSDAGSTSMWDIIAVTTQPDPIPAGVYVPSTINGVRSTFRQLFNGTQAAGTWTLTAKDYVGGDTGTISSWTLNLTQAAASTCAPASVLCCRGATCTYVAPASCTLTGSIPIAAGVFTANVTSPACAAFVGGTPSTFRTPCCLGDYNKVNGVGVQDILDFIQDWLAAKPYAIPGGNGQTGTPAVQDLLNFFTAWLAGNCP